MTELITTIIALVIIIALIIINIIIKRKNPNKNPLNRKIKKIKLALLILGLILFAFSSYFCYRNLNTFTMSNNDIIKTCLLEGLTTFILVLPLSIDSLYEHLFKEEKISHTKFIIAKEYNKEYLRKLNAAGIYVYFETSKKVKNNYLSLAEAKNFPQGNYYINPEDSKHLKNEYLLRSSKSLAEIYDLILDERGKHDNYIRAFEFNILLYVPIIVSLIIFYIQGFPICIDIFMVSLLKLGTFIVSHHIFPSSPYDVDLMTRHPKKYTDLLGEQEWIMIILESFCLCFVITIPYMFLLSEGTTVSFAGTMLISTYLFTIIFLLFSTFSSKMLIKNIIPTLKYRPTRFLIILIILLTIAVNYIPYNLLDNIGLQNYFASIIIALIAVFFPEFTKIARYFTMKGRKKNVSKNNQKHRRSQSHNA